MVDCPWVPTESVFKETYKQLKIKNYEKDVT